MPIRNRRALLALGPAVASAVVVTALVVAPGANAAHVEPTVVNGNPSCADVLPGSTEFKAEPVASGTHSDGTVTVQLAVQAKKFDWSANRAVQAVIVKGGPSANVYDYGADGAVQDNGLKAPGSSGLSHVSFCYGGGDPKEPPTTTTTTETKPTETTTTTTTETTTTAPPPQGGRCTGWAYDVRLDVSGIIEGYVGPVAATEKDKFPDRDTFSDLKVVFPLTGATEPVVQATTLDAENSGNPQDGCKTRVTYENAVVDLDNITPEEGDIPVRLTAKVLETTAVSTLNPDGTVTRSSQVTIIGGSIDINGQGGALPEDQVPPNSGYTNEPECFASDLGKLCVTVMLHETELIPGGISANAVRIKVHLVTALPETSSQLVDLKLAHAEADAHAE